MPDYRLPDGRVPVLLSSHTSETLNREITALLGYLDDHPEVTAEAVADALWRTRTRHRHRILAAVPDRDRLMDALRCASHGDNHPNLIRATADNRSTALVFPGHSSMQPGMAQLYYETSPAFRAEVDRCDAIFAGKHGMSPRSYLLDSDRPDTDRPVELQPALFVVSVALAAMWRAAGIRPVACIGHSLGEFATAYVSGAMSLCDAIAALTIRAQLVDELHTDGYRMAVVATERETCLELLARHNGWAELSVVNSPNMQGISGEPSTVSDLVATVAASGRFAREVRVGFPAHTSMMNRYREKLGRRIRDTLDAVTFTESEIVPIGAALGAPMGTELPHADYWFLNLRNTVRFDRAITAAIGAGVDTFVEVSLHPTLLWAITQNLTTAIPAAGNGEVVLGTSHRNATDLTEFADNVARAAAGNLDYRWAALAPASPTTAVAPDPIPMDFPHTQMSQVRLWADTESHPYCRTTSGRHNPQPHPRGSTVNDPAPECLTEAWTIPSGRTLLPPRRMLVIDPLGGSVLPDDAITIGAKEYNASVRYAGTESLAPTDCNDTDTIVILIPPLPAKDVADAITLLADILSAHHALPHLPDGADVWLVTVDGEHVVDGDLPQLCPAALVAVFRGMGAEYPTHRLRRLDLDGTDVAQHPIDAAAGLLAAVHTAGESELAWRSKSLYAKRLTPTTGPKREAPDIDNVLITGGTGKLGLAFAEHFARTGAQRITLLGRSGHTPSVAALSHIRADCEIMAHACDITDESTLRELTSEPFTTIIHTAGTYVPGDSVDLTEAKIRSALGAKVIGIDTVLRLLPRARTCRVLLCSSFVTTLPTRGQLLYAASNRMLDALARRLRADKIDCDAVQWGLWEIQGFLDEAKLGKVRGMGLLPMNSTDAIVAGLGSTGNSIVTAVDWSTLRVVIETAGMGSLLEEMATSTPAAVPASAIDPNEIRRHVAAAMGLTDADAIDGSTPLVALGLDSLQTLDLYRRLKVALGRELDISAVMTGASLIEVIAHLSGQQPTEQGVR